VILFDVVPGSETNLEGAEALTAMAGAGSGWLIGELLGRRCMNYPGGGPERCERILLDDEGVMLDDGHGDVTRYCDPCFDEVRARHGSGPTT
jgi:hypothetical protein